MPVGRGRETGKRNFWRVHAIQQILLRGKIQPGTVVKKDDFFHKRSRGQYRHLAARLGLGRRWPCDLWSGLPDDWRCDGIEAQKRLLPRSQAPAKGAKWERCRRGRLEARQGHQVAREIHHPEKEFVRASDPES